MTKHMGRRVETRVAACAGGHVHMQFGHTTNIVLSSDSFVHFARTVLEMARGLEGWSEACAAPTAGVN